MKTSKHHSIRWVCYLLTFQFCLAVLPAFAQGDKPGKIYADYISQNLDERVKTHRVIAILPADVSIAYKKLQNNFSIDSTLQQEKEIAYFWQQHFYLALKNNFADSTLHVQPVDSTNLLLLQAGFVSDSFHYYNRTRLADMLHADALIQNDLLLSKMRTETEATALTLASVAGSIITMANAGYAYYFPSYFSTFEVDFTLSIYDANGELLWMARPAQQYEKPKAKGKDEKEKRRFPYVKP